MASKKSPLKIKKQTINERAVELRNELGLNQQQFWSKLGVTQSGGSRYEGGRKIPKPTQMLLLIAHDLATVDELVSGELARSLG